MVSRVIWIKQELVSFSKPSNSTRPSDSCYFEVFEKLTRACFIQIALESLKVCESDPNPSPIQSDPDSNSNLLGSDFFFFCRIGSDFVGFLLDRIWVFSCIACVELLEYQFNKLR